MGEGEARSGLSPKAIVAIVLGVAAVIFILQNSSSGKVSLLLWDMSAPRWLWTVILFGAGVIVGSLKPWLGLRDRKD